ncbi:plasmid replication DNA-binding protein [Acinetobacter sp. ANC 4654]|uniref:plasmid replication DNA-binding protein n=1 Tax=Acinetobacter sp. ANC 4654 TaxID=1977872 RepID=UPI001D17342B|nr:plasmid replication DNA-binding protein [Acinetobacter sp. ANC 4654]
MNSLSTLFRTGDNENKTSMARISISQAARDFKVSRNSIYKKINSGQLTKDSDGLVDTSDMLRLFSSSTTKQQSSTASDNVQVQILGHREQLLQQEVDKLKMQVQALEQQLQYVQANEAWLKQQLDQKLIEHKNNEKKGLLGRIFG